MTPRPPLPPFTEDTARQKVQAGEDAWNTRDPERVAGAYSAACTFCRAVASVNGGSGGRGVITSPRVLTRWRRTPAAGSPS